MATWVDERRRKSGLPESETERSGTKAVPGELHPIRDVAARPGDQMPAKVDRARVFTAGEMSRQMGASESCSDSEGRNRMASRPKMISAEHASNH